MRLYSFYIYGGVSVQAILIAMLQINSTCKKFIFKQKTWRLKSPVRMTLELTLDYLYTQLPMYQRVGAAAMKKDLRNIIALCEALGNPHHKFKSIHIAGTNGKGSTAHMLSAILQADGLKTGLYTSPHYRDFRERIKLDGQYVTEQFVVDFVARNKPLFERIQPSFFEITVAMAFQYFAENQVDIAVIETGLGGRLDSTNILSPLLSIITNISYDHQQFLGDTLAEIAAEKAGIIKPNTPVVISERQEEVAHIFEHIAAERNAPIYFASDFFDIKEKAIALTGNTYHISPLLPSNSKKKIENYLLKTDLYGNYQSKNLCGVLLSEKILNEEKIISNERSKFEGLQAVKSLANFMGRWQVISEKPLTVCDSGHNTAGISGVVNQLAALAYRQLHIVIGMVKDKDHEKVIKLLPKDAIYYIAKPDIPRGMDAEKLTEKFVQVGLRARAYESVPNALRVAQEQAQEEDLVFVGGSIFVVGEVL